MATLKGKWCKLNECKIECFEHKASHRHDTEHGNKLPANHTGSHSLFFQDT